MFSLETHRQNLRIVQKEYDYQCSLGENGSPVIRRKWYDERNRILACIASHPENPKNQKDS